ncbi:MAG TPA: hypothetical protein VNA27_08275 [Rubrobacteraceae bacterium]|nr:hypothetical protein [Rubrobacteraceae bacterium]
MKVLNRAGVDLTSAVAAQIGLGQYQTALLRVHALGQTVGRPGRDPRLPLTVPAACFSILL